jgi:cytochrome b561
MIANIMFYGLIAAALSLAFLVGVTDTGVKAPGMSAHQAIGFIIGLAFLSRYLLRKP